MAGPATTLCGIELAHPVINGSGTFDALAAARVFGPELRERFPFSAFVSKTITPEPRAGNSPPRLWETSSGMVNSIGLPNKGLEGFLASDLPALGKLLPVPLVVSVMATSHGEFARLVDGVASREEAAGLELNVSCPNVESGLTVGESPEETESLLRHLRPLTDKPLIVKLTPNVHPAPVAAAAERGGADAVSLINTLRAVPMDPDGGGLWLGAGRGGLSGASVRAIAVNQVREVAAEVSIPVVGMGGVASGRDAAGLIAAGATVVAVGTESFRDPTAGARIADELHRSLQASAA